MLTLHVYVKHVYHFHVHIPLYIYMLIDKLPTGVVDPLLLQCVSYLNKEEVLKEPGLFHIPGDITIIKRLRSQFIVGM